MVGRIVVGALLVALLLANRIRLRRTSDAFGADEPDDRRSA